MPIEYNPLKSGSLEPPVLAKLVFPGVRGSAKSDISVGNITFPAGSKLIIQPLNKASGNEPARFKLTRYVDKKSIHSELPESNREVDIQESIEITSNAPSDLLRFDDEQYERVEGAGLFKKGSPCIEDINQALIPNCFFLASLASLVNHPNGPSYIRNMMRQHSDGTTTVRLYHPVTREPLYVRVETSYLVDSSGTLNAHQGLWVDILEKAYASIPEVLSKHDASMTSVYAGGGQEKTALMTLTPFDVAQHDIKQHVAAWDIPNTLDNAAQELKEALELEILMGKEKINAIVAEALAEYQPTYAPIFGQEEWLDTLKELIRFYLDNQEAMQTICNPDKAVPDTIADIIGLIDLRIKENDSSDLEMLTRVRENFRTILSHDFIPTEQSNPHTVRGERTPFSGYYSPQDLIHFNRIQDALSDNKMVTANTLSDFKEVPGLRAHHSYTILNAYEKSTPSANGGSMVDAYMIRLRNPWGNTGRVYMPSLDGTHRKEVECSAAEVFELELKDFIKHYKQYNITDSPNDLFGLTKRQEDFNERVVHVLSGWNITTHTSLPDLLDTLQEFQALDKEFDAIQQLQPAHLLPHDIANDSPWEQLLKNRVYVDELIKERYNILPQILSTCSNLLAMMLELQKEIPDTAGPVRTLYLKQYYLLFTQLEGDCQLLSQYQQAFALMYPNDSSEDSPISQFNEQMTSLTRQLTQLQLKNNKLETKAPDMKQAKQIAQASYEPTEWDLSSRQQSAFAKKLDNLHNEIVRYQPLNVEEKLQISRLKRIGMAFKASWQRLCDAVSNWWNGPKEPGYERVVASTPRLSNEAREYPACGLFSTAKNTSQTSLESSLILAH